MEIWFEDEARIGQKVLSESRMRGNLHVRFDEGGVETELRLSH